MNERLCQRDLTLTESEILALISALNHADRKTKRATELKETIYSRLGRRFVDIYNECYYNREGEDG